MFTRRELREEVARVFRMYEGSITAGSLNTLTDSALRRFDSDYWVGAQVYIVQTGMGGPWEATSWVSAYDRQSSTLTLDPPLYAWPDAGTRYQLYRWVTMEDINAALSEAARGTQIATSLVPKSDSVDYYLDGAPGLSRDSQINGVYVRYHGDVKYPVDRLSTWEIEDAEGQLTLRLPFTLHEDDQLWLTYSADETYLNSDSRAVNLPKQLVIARAVVHLLRRVMIDQDASGQERFGQLLRYYEDVLNREEIRYQRPAGRAQGYDWDH